MAFNDNKYEYLLENIYNLLFGVDIGEMILLAIKKIVIKLMILMNDIIGF